MKDCSKCSEMDWYTCQQCREKKFKDFKRPESKNAHMNQLIDAIFTDHEKKTEDIVRPMGVLSVEEKQSGLDLAFIKKCWDLGPYQGE